ncbi:neuraminidase-like domain-containing protein [Pseudomonas sp. NA-150]|uniref:Tc toxin subunit A-related protein n=1 Tax=Pseudomonas sp. NA-150 TaxID=3367525 RepID=UPI0037C6368B
MSTSIDSQLNETLRDALVAYYLGEVATNSPKLAELGLTHKLKNADDLYQFLLLDVQVSQEVQTSWVASAISSLQQYINGILMGMEPGYESKTLEPHQISLWRDQQAQYPIWAANQQLAWYPEIYIDPSLRLKKSDYFRQLENDINQNKIEVDTVQEAVKTYLTNFEEVANLSIVNGYIDTDDFANGTYYFIGKSRGETAYYWRSVDMSQRSFKAGADGPKHDTPQPGAWSDWRKASLPISENAVEHTIRPVHFNNRLFVSWLEYISSDSSTFESTYDEDPKFKTRSLVRMNMVYKKYDNSWSAPHTYMMWHTDADPKTLDSIAVQDSTTSLLIAMYAGYRAGSDKEGTSDTYSFLKTARVDKNFNTLPLFPTLGLVPDKSSQPVKQAHVLNVARTFALTNKNRFQFKTPDLKISIKSVKNLTPGAGVKDWNINQWQPNIRDLHLHTDIRYNPTTSLLEFSSKVNQPFQMPIQTITINFTIRTNVTHTITLITRAVSTDSHHLLLPGSGISPPLPFRHSSIPYDFFDFDLLGPTGITIDWCRSFICDSPFDTKLTLPKPVANIASLSGKYVKNTARQIISNPSKSIDFLQYNGHYGDGYYDRYSSTRLTLTRPALLNYQHYIARPTQISNAWPATRLTEQTDLKISTRYTSITHVNSLTYSIPINEETLLPDWGTTWPAGKKEIPFIHGVLVQDGNNQNRYLGAATKGVTVELQLLPATSKDLKAPKINTHHSESLGTAEFIDFNDSDISRTDGSTSANRSPLRMNTLFARELTEKANVALEYLLSWETQGLPEPPMQNSGGKPDHMDFHGANGLYFWELFLHLPFLISHRLNLEQDFTEAERWMGFIFDPGRKADTSIARPAFWNVRPLVEEKTSSSYSTLAATDPDGIASSHPIRYQKAVYNHYLKNLIDQGDAAYRQLTPDSLGEAKLWYVRVLDLLGNRPDIRLIDHWTPVSLQKLSRDKNQKLRAFEMQLNNQDQLRLQSQQANNGVSEYTFEQPPLRLRSFAEDPTLPEIDNPYLRLPINFKLVALWDTLESRLSNLRNNRTLDGKPLSLPIFAAPLDPRDVLAAFGQGATGGKGSRLLTLDTPHYRFSIMHSRANAAVETLMQFGNTLLSLIERKEQAELLELQHQQAWDFAQFAIDLQKQALKIDQENREALLASRRIVEGRLAFYSERSDEIVSPGEIAAGAAHLVGRHAETVSAVANIVGSALKTVPNQYGVIVGFSNGAITGGWRLEGPAEMISAAASGVAATSHGIGEALDRVEQYRRRHQEWMHARDQAQLETQQIDAQLKVLDEQDQVTALQLRQAETALEQAKITYAFLGKRFTKSQLYQWLNGQLASFYYQVYDATLSLCLAAEASWQYELADFSTRFIQTGAWNDAYRGLTAGESLKLNLLKMESAYLSRNERVLEISKTVSLRQLKAKDSASALNKDWETVYTKLQADGSVDFELTQPMFDNDYPGQYCRRIKRISVSLPVTLGPYEDIRATLTQTYNKAELANNVGASVRENLRASQQIALSSGVDDDGMFTLNFDDERYLPFEGTGAISRWSLRFPAHADQKTMLESLTDIIVHVQYTAKAGTGA